jgi:hypothetical protein
MRLDGTTRFTIVGPTFYGNYLTAIYLNSVADGTINGIDDWAGSGTETVSIFVNNTLRVRVRDSVYLNGSTFSIQEGGTSDYNLYDGNNSSVGRIVTLGAHSKVSNNYGLNPRGLITSSPTPPAIASTTTPVTNSTGFDCMVNVVGGTVTAIAVGGTTLTGITSGLVFVPAGQTITLTYSSAPTWQWIGN